MTIEPLNDRVAVVREGPDRLFVGLCAEGCSWQLFPKYRPDLRTFHWIAQHGQNEEAVLVFERSAPFDAAAMMAAIDDWLDRCHAYEATPFDKLRVNP